ncbi:MAG: hypothetical protein ACTFAL_10930 [Candidatus Electronema sp. V4]|uniref:hypothetical protein n=1 Tax=Candidatus Electronema sp. V4 TaxID=3454756 RepID=UPI004055656D
MNIPKTIEDIEKIIEMKVPESLHLDYKASPAFSPEKKARMFLRLPIQMVEC